jgi:pyridoxine 5-phosphate synthase
MEIINAAQFGKQIGLEVNAGHGLNYRNVQAVSTSSPIDEMSIGHAIISRAAFVGLEQAVKEMLALLK